MRSEAFGGVSSNPMNHRGASPADRPATISGDRHHYHHHHERGGSGQNVKMEEEDDSDDEDSASTTNDEAAVANALHMAKENLISKAFDTMAKVFLFFCYIGNVVIMNKPLRVYSSALTTLRLITFEIAFDTVCVEKYSSFFFKLD